MLSLSRRHGQAIYLRVPGLSRMVKIKVYEFREQKDNLGHTIKAVRLAFDAPQEVTILREEIVPEDERWDG